MSRPLSFNRCNELLLKVVVELKQKSSVYLFLLCMCICVCTHTAFGHNNSMLIITSASGKPDCLHNLLNTFPSICCLRSQDNHLVAKPSVYTSTGRHTFSYTNVQIWNAIPLNICISPSVILFRHNFKTYYYAAAF